MENQERPFLRVGFYLVIDTVYRGWVGCLQSAVEAVCPRLVLVALRRDLLYSYPISCFWIESR
jgi:hypothetical protein